MKNSFPVFTFLLCLISSAYGAAGSQVMGSPLLLTPPTRPYSRGSQDFRPVTPHSQSQTPMSGTSVTVYDELGVNVDASQRTIDRKLEAERNGPLMFNQESAAQHGPFIARVDGAIGSRKRRQTYDDKSESRRVRRKCNNNTTKGLVAKCIHVLGDEGCKTIERLPWAVTHEIIEQGVMPEKVDLARLMADIHADDALTERCYQQFIVMLIERDDIYAQLEILAQEGDELARRIKRRWFEPIVQDTVLEVACEISPRVFSDSTCHGTLSNWYHKTSLFSSYVLSLEYKQEQDCGHAVIQTFIEPSTFQHHCFDRLVQLMQFLHRRYVEDQKINYEVDNENALGLLLIIFLSSGFSLQDIDKAVTGACHTSVRSVDRDKIIPVVRALVDVHNRGKTFGFIQSALVCNISPVCNNIGAFSLHMVRDNDDNE